ncbi:MAG TPA: ABC transporter permease [Patescibacteria group bacterium]|nr:ABC transporter permease [Patescibacteria group bacterium]
MKLYRLYAFSLRHLYPLKRDFDLLSDMIYWPIIDVLLWGITSRWLGEASGLTAIIATILTGLILWNVIWRSQSEISRNLIDEIWNNNLVNLFSTPLTLAEWITGVLVLSVGKTIFTISLLTPIVLLLYSVNIFMIGWWLIPFFVGAVMTGWWVGFISAGIVIRYGPKVQTVVWTLPGILLPFSVVYFPLAMLPTFLHPISYLIPTTYIFESMRQLLLNGFVDPPLIVLSFALNIIYLILALAWFRASFRASLSLGLGRFN